MTALNARPCADTEGHMECGPGVAVVQSSFFFYSSDDLVVSEEGFCPLAVLTDLLWKRTSAQKCPHYDLLDTCWHCCNSGTRPKMPSAPPIVESVWLPMPL
jgi:hypothetical protein